MSISRVPLFKKKVPPVTKKTETSPPAKKVPIAKNVSPAKEESTLQRPKLPQRPMLKIAPKKKVTEAPVLPPRPKAASPPKERPEVLTKPKVISKKAKTTGVGARASASAAKKTSTTKKQRKTIHITGVDTVPIEEFTWLDTGVYYQPQSKPRAKQNKFYLSNTSRFPSYVIDRWYSPPDDLEMNCDQKDKVRLPYTEAGKKKYMRIEGKWDNDQDNTGLQADNEDEDEIMNENEKITLITDVFTVTDERNRRTLEEYLRLPGSSKHIKAIRSITGELEGFSTLERPGLEENDEMFFYQRFIASYMNIDTPYRGILLYHGLGSGKSRTAIEIAKLHRANGKEIVFMSPAALVDNFIKEAYRWQLIDDELFAKLYKPGTSKRNRRDMLKDVGIYIVNYNGNLKLAQLSYAMEPYNASLSTEANLNKATLKNKVVIIDEIHNLVLAMTNDLSREKVGLSGRIYNILMNCRNCRIVGLSGTPMVNRPQELAVLFNILRGPIKYGKSSNVQGNMKRMYGYNDSKAGKQIVKNLNPNLYSISENHVNDNHSYDLFPIHMDLPQDLRFSDFNNRFVDLEKVTLKNKDEFIHRIMGLVSYYSGAKGQVYPDIVNGDGRNMDEKIESWEIQTTPISLTPIIIDEHEVSQWYQYEDARYKDEKRKKSFGSKKVTGAGAKRTGPSYHMRAMRAQTLQQKISSASAAMKQGANDSSFRTFSRLVSNFMDIKDRDEELATFYERLDAYPQYFMASDSGSGDEGLLEYASPKMAQILTNVNLLTGVADPENVLGYDDLVLISEYIDAEFDAAMQDSDLDTAYEYMAAKYDAGTCDVDAISALPIADDKKEKYSVKICMEINRYLEQIVYDLQTYNQKQTKQIIDQIKVSPKEIGNGLIYSNFRTAEGIEYMGRVLQNNGYNYFDYEQYKRYLEDPDNYPPYVKTILNEETGKYETIPEEIVGRNTDGTLIWEYDGRRYSILGRDSKKHGQEFTTEIVIEYNKPDNSDGSVIKLLLGTANMSEGLDLKNIRHIHIMEPHWNMVRIKQTIGRARRICSHASLDKDKWTIRVFLYQALLPYGYKDPLDTGNNADNSTDQVIYNIALAKELLKEGFIDAIKEAAVDCVLNAVHNTPANGKAPTCIYYPKYEPLSQTIGEKKNQITYTYYPDIGDDKKLTPIYDSYKSYYNHAKRNIILEPLDDPKGNLPKEFYMADGRTPKYMVPVNIGTDTIKLKMKGVAKDFSGMPLYDYQIYKTTGIPHFVGYLTSDEIIRDLSNVTVVSGDKYI